MIEPAFLYDNDGSIRQFGLGSNKKTYLQSEISSRLKIPVIGIGSGKFCDGQILVLYDLLGISFNGIPKFFNNDYLKINNFKDRIKRFIKDSRNK